MRFSTIFTVLAAGAMAFASVVPNVIAKRDEAAVDNALSILSSACGTILPGLSTCSDNTCTTSIIADLNVAIGTCTSTLGGITGGAGGLTDATLVVSIVTEIADALAAHKSQCGTGCPNVDEIYASVDLSLSICLQAVFNLLTGVLALVEVLLTVLVLTLNGLGFTNVLSVCGL